MSVPGRGERPIWVNPEELLAAVRSRHRDGTDREHDEIEAITNTLDLAAEALLRNEQPQDGIDLDDGRWAVPVRGYDTWVSLVHLVHLSLESGERSSTFKYGVLLER